MRLWDAATGQELVSLAHQRRYPQGLAFDRAGQRLFLLLGYPLGTTALPASLAVLDASPLALETLAGDRIDALAATVPLHDELKTQLMADSSLPVDVRAAVPGVQGRAESVSRLLAMAGELSPLPDRPVAEYERACGTPRPPRGNVPTTPRSSAR